MNSLNNLVKLCKPYIIPPNNKSFTNLAVIQNYNKPHPSVNNFMMDISKINEYPSRDIYNILSNELGKYTQTSCDNILITPGSGYALQLILNTFSNINSKLLIPFPNYPGFIHDAELLIKNINLYRFNGSDCEYANLNEEIKNNDIIYISSPNIPLGYELRQDFMDTIKLYSDKLFIIDEAYFEYSESLSFINLELDNIIITRTFSKAFALAGARLGYIVTTKRNIEYLNIGYCTKSVLDLSLNLGYNTIIHKDYYYEQVKDDKNNWNNFYKSLKSIINNNDIIYDFSYGNAPFFLIYTEEPKYVCNIFKKNNYIVRNKTNDLNKGCIRITLSINNIISDIYDIIKKINGYSKYDIMYLDIDKTIRNNYNSPPVDGVVEKINNFKENNIIINFITNNKCKYNIMENYLNEYNFQYDELIMPLNKEMNISISEIDNGYFVYCNKLYVLKFPKIDYNIINLIQLYKIVHIIEEDEYENSQELGYKNIISLPFIGCFKKIILNIPELVDIEFKIIGKANKILSNIPKNKDIIMIGDSNDDFTFAKNNLLYFKRVNNDIIDILDNLDFIKVK